MTGKQAATEETYFCTATEGTLTDILQKDVSSDSSQTSSLPFDISLVSSIESLIYSLCAKRSHSVKVGSSRS